MKILLSMLAILMAGSSAHAGVITCKFDRFGAKVATARNPLLYTAAFLSDCPLDQQQVVQLRSEFAIVDEGGDLKEANSDAAKLQALFNGVAKGTPVTVDVEIVHGGYGGYGAYGQTITVGGKTVTMYRGDLVDWIDADIGLLND